MKKLNFIIFAVLAASTLQAQLSHELWLGDREPAAVKVVSLKSSPTIEIAKQELKDRWAGAPGSTIRIVVDKNGNQDLKLKGDGYKLDQNTIEAKTDIGALYGVYALLRRQQTGEPVSGVVSNPSYEQRILDHWDNLDGSVERGYAGNSIFWHGKDSLAVLPSDQKLWHEYARANCSIGINGAVINNVNASPLILTPAYLMRVKAIADVLRPYGIKTYLSVNFASPASLGELNTADPLDAKVILWWQKKVKEIYTLIPDFGGFLVKASSEGQPGPQNYGRTHADGANMLADALKPFNGIVMWRAFVYTANDNDRAKQAYSEFTPLDGKFRDNVIIQVKNGPIDFQPREPFSPLFGAMKKTSVMPEFQITQEYLGHSTHLVFLATMWEECLKSDTYQEGKGSTVARVTNGSIYKQSHTAIAGVSNIGLDSNWCGHPFAQANWYAFGRLAWNDNLRSAQIADEWIKLTFHKDAAMVKNDPDYVSNWSKHFLQPVKQMMLNSREAAVNYMMPLGLHHIMSANGHYGPGPWWAPKGVRSDWTPPYYHQADKNGIGFDRTTHGSGAVSQYHEPVLSTFNNLATCPDIYLLWFHHLPWKYKMKDGHTLWEALCYHYDKGVKQVRSFQKIWDQTELFVDSSRFLEVQTKLRYECSNAIVWKDACLLYFQEFSQLPIPYDIERPVHMLKDIRADEFKKRIK